MIFDFLHLLVFGVLTFYIIQLQRQFEEFETDMNMILFSESEDKDNDED